MTKNLRSKSIIESSILTALIFIFMSLTQIFGLSIVASIITPIPLVIIYVKYGFKTSILSVLASLILMTIMFGPVIGVMNIISTSVIGIPFGFGIRNKKTGNVTLFYVFMANLVGTIINLALSLYLVLNMTLVGFIQNCINLYKEQIDTIIKSTTNPEVIASYKNMIESFTPEKVLIVLPTILLFYVLISTVISYTVTRVILVKLRYKVNNFNNFTRWYLPPMIIAGFVLIAIIGMGLKMNGVNAGKDIFEAVWNVLFMLMAIQGLSLAVYFMKIKLKLSTVVIVFISAILIIMVAPITYLFAIGVVDVLLDYRSVDPESLGSFIRRKVNKE